MANIIVVDDDPSICKAIESQLSLDGHVVRVATAPDTAIDLGHLFETDLVITDWNLKAEYDGFEVLEAVLAVRSDVLAIIISGYGFVFEPRYDHFLSIPKIAKPFSLSYLSETVRRLLQERN